MKKSNIDFKRSNKLAQYELESLFWMEIAKRKQYKKNKKAYLELMQLRKDLTNFFKPNWNNLEEPLSGLVDDFFDVIQFEESAED